MRRKPKVKIVYIRKLNYDRSIAEVDLMERLYIDKEQRMLGYKIYSVGFSTRDRYIEKITPALDEVDAMRQVFSVMTIKHQELYKLNRYGCPK